MNRTKSLAGILFLALFVILSHNLFAWGPMTHLSVNQQAYERAVREMGDLLCIPAAMADDFIGGGPCPDIKSQGGASFPRDFHNDPDTVVRMIERAKNDPQFGQADVVMALGWAGHVFGEVWTAHADDGYANNKVTIPIPQSTGINHQINELCLDLLSYRRNRDSLVRKHLAVPVRLLEAAMKAEQEKNGEMPKMSAAEIKSATNRFLPTVVGIRIISEYLMRERPDLLDEMDGFFSDSLEQLDSSADRVLQLLREHGARSGVKAVAKSLDSRERVKLGLQGDLSSKFKGWAFSALAKVLQNGGANDIFTVLAYRMVKGALFTPFTREPFLEKAKSAGSASVWGNPQHNRVVTRFTEGLLTRGDLTFPEIIAFAMEGFEPGSSEKKKQLEQFKKSGLNACGRKPVQTAQVLESLKEVERLEGLQRDWPWFWPWRPSDLRLAQARERSGRLLAWHFEDSGLKGSVGTRWEGFWKNDQKLRSTIWEYRMTPWYQPISKWNQKKNLAALSDSFGKENAFFAEILRVQLQLEAQGNTPARINAMKAETEQRVREAEYAVQAAKAQLGKLPAWNLISRDKKKDEIKKLEHVVQELRSRLEVLQTLAGNAGESEAKMAATPVGATSETIDLELGRNVSLADAQKKYESAYAEYAAFAAQPNPDETAMKDLLEKLSLARRVREAVIARLEAEKAAAVR